NTVDIAKYAGVSTGIVYGYFRDKRDILLEVLQIYIDNVFSPFLDMFDKMQKPLDFRFLISHAVEETVNTHRQNAAIHQALHALTSTDATVNERFLTLEGEMTHKIAVKLIALGYDREDLTERIHLALETIQSYAHECIYDKHSYINYGRMNEIVTDMLITLFE
ncbi:MAG: TetR/AcrR family transcriptional regulator, partial [Christensenellales bacterium]